MKYELDLNKTDVGEIIEIIRVQHIRLTDEAFAKFIGVSPKILMDAENGKGSSGINILQKIQDRFKNVTVSIVVDIK